MGDFNRDEPIVVDSRLVCRVPQNASGEIRRWGPRKLKYFTASYVLPVKTQEDLTAACYRSWSDVCGLSFEPTKNAAEAHIIIKAGRGPRANLDGKGGTLGYAYLPAFDGHDSPLSMVLDLDEKWSAAIEENVIAGAIKFVAVKGHEDGHTIGLDHGGAEDLMASLYNPKLWLPQKRDIERAQVLYGPPKALATPNAPTVPELFGELFGELEFKLRHAGRGLETEWTRVKR